MSFLHMMTLCDGTIIATDSRLTILTNGSISKRLNNQQKIFIVPGTSIVVAFSGQTRFSSFEIPMDDVVKGLQSKDRYGIANELREKLRIYAAKNNIVLLIAEVKSPTGADGFGYTTHAIKLAHDEQEEDNTWHLSEEVFARGISFSSGADWAVGYAKHADLPYIDVEHCVPMVKAFMENIINADRNLRYSNHTIGGPVQLAVLTPEKAEILYNNNQNDKLQ